MKHKQPFSHPLSGYLEPLPGNKSARAWNWSLSSEVKNECGSHTQKGILQFFNLPSLECRLIFLWRNWVIIVLLAFLAPGCSVRCRILFITKKSTHECIKLLLILSSMCGGSSWLSAFVYNAYTVFSVTEWRHIKLQKSFQALCGEVNCV
jgi:hypothetical protein